MVYSQRSPPAHPLPLSCSHELAHCESHVAAAAGDFQFLVLVSTHSECFCKLSPSYFPVGLTLC